MNKNVGCDGQYAAIKSRSTDIGVVGIAKCETMTSDYELKFRCCEEDKVYFGSSAELSFLGRQVHVVAGREIGIHIVEYLLCQSSHPFDGE